MNELEHFYRIAGDNSIRQWLEKQLDEAIRYLSEAMDTVQIYRAQGKIQFVNRMLDNLDKAKNLR